MSGWWEFLWGGLAGVFGETLMHPVDTLKTRLQSGGAIGLSVQRHGDVRQAFKAVWSNHGVQGFYRGVVPGLTGSFITGATYFGFIEGSKDWLEQNNPNLVGPWAHFVAGATGDTIGSVIYVPCEVIKQRMQIQGSRKGFQSAAKLNKTLAGQQYYTGLFSAGRSILHQEGVRGLYAGYISTLARDVPFAGFQIMFYEAFRRAVEHAHVRWSKPGVVVKKREFNSLEELVIGGVAGGISAFICTPLDVVKTRLQVQGTNIRYKGWADAFQTIYREERLAGLFKGSVPRVLWYVPAAGLTFMTVELLRKRFNDVPGGPVEFQQRELPGRAVATLDLAALGAPVPSYDEQIRKVKKIEARRHLWTLLGSRGVGENTASVSTSDEEIREDLKQALMRAVSNTNCGKVVDTLGGSAQNIADFKFFGLNGSLNIKGSVIKAAPMSEGAVRVDVTFERFVLKIGNWMLPSVSLSWVKPKGYAD